MNIFHCKAAAGIPTYRGTSGIDTKADMKHKDENEDEDESDDCIYTKLKPTLTHRSLASLGQSGWLSYTVTQNCDDLHAKGGADRSKLTELHGNGTC
jgi:NAD-dependent SIR2 family protein deacetylase